MENCAENGFEFDDAEKFPERLLLKGRSQETVQELSEACGWKDDLLQRKEKADAKHTKERETIAKGEAKDDIDELTK